MTAALMEADRPKSSALTMSRRGELADAIVRHPVAAPDAVPAAQDEKRFVKLGQACFAKFKDIEAAAFQFAEELPIDRAH